MGSPALGWPVLFMQGARAKFRNDTLTPFSTGMKSAAGYFPEDPVSVPVDAPVVVPVTLVVDVPGTVAQVGTAQSQGRLHTAWPTCLV
jgi:hypothetical protein